MFVLNPLEGHNGTKKKETRIYKYIKKKKTEEEKRQKHKMATMATDATSTL